MKKYNFENKEKEILEQLKIPLVVCEVYRNTIIPLVLSEGICDIFETTRDNDFNEIIKKIQKNIYSEDFYKILEIKNKILENRQQNLSTEFRYLNEYNIYRWFKCEIDFEKKQDNIILIYIYLLEISKSIEHIIGEDEFSNYDIENIKEKELIRNSTSSIMVIDRKKFNVLYCNETFKKNIAVPKEYYKPCYKVFFGENKKCSYCGLKNKKSDNEVTTVYVEHLEKYFKIRYLETIWEGIPAYIELIKDVTEYEKNLKKRKEKLKKCKQRYSEIKVNALADKKILAYYRIDINTNTLLDGNSQNFKNEDVPKGGAMEWIKENTINNILIETDKNKYNEILSVKNIYTAMKKEKRIISDFMLVEYNKEKKYIRKEIEFSFDLKLKHYIAYIYSFDETKVVLEKKAIKTINKNEFEWIVWFERDLNKCTIICEKDIDIGLKKGKHTLKINEYFNRCSKYLGIEKQKLLKRYNACIYGNIEHRNKQFLYTINSSNKIQKHIRSDYFFSDDYIKILCCAIIDVTELIKSKEEQRKIIELSKNKAEELKVIAENERQKAEMANAVKTDFLARMSHDMRTPLGAIIGLSNFGIEETEEKKLKEYFNEIKSSSKYLLSLLNDILKMQKIESGKIDLYYETTNISDIIDKIITVVKYRASQKNIDFKIIRSKKNRDIYVEIDERRFEQILINILINAIKYTDAGGNIVWKIEIEKVNKKIEINSIVKDTGVGMSEEFQTHMFEPFSKEDNKLSKLEGGSGLGLAIAKNLIEKMGGTISCKSKINKGTKFNINIPFKISTYEEIEKYKKLPEKFEFINKEVLLCEDMEINVKIISKILKSVGLNVDIAKNGEQGVEKVRKKKYDIIFMDIRMPIMDGLIATQIIRSFDNNIPIIALSANAYADDVQKSLNVGMNAHLSKPVIKDKIFECLIKYIK